MEHFDCDVLVVGSGAAGLRAAIAAKSMGCDVAVISKNPPGKGTCTILSGGFFAGTPQGEPFTTHYGIRTILSIRPGRAEFSVVFNSAGVGRLRAIIQ